MRPFLLLVFLSTFHLVSSSWAQTSPLITIYGAYAVDEEATSIAVDHKGNIYSTGTMYASSMTFDTLTVQNPSTNRAMVVVKQDANGKAKWARIISGDQGANRITRGQAIVIDPEDNLYVAGTWNSGPIHIDDTPIEGQAGIFLVKMNKDGHTLWVNEIDGNSDNVRLELGMDGMVHVLGSMSNDITIGDTLLYAYTTETHFFMATYNRDGAFQWGKSFGSGVQAQSGTDFAIDPEGNFWVTGVYNYSMTMDKFSLQNSGTNNAYIAKIDSKGQTLWAKNLPYQIQAEIRLATDPFGNAYWASIPSRRGYFLKFDTQGNTIWKDSTYSEANFDGDIGDVATDPLGNVYFTGTYYTDIQIGNVSHDYGSFYDVFLVKYYANGSRDFIRYYQGPSWDTPSGMYIAGPSSDVYICGESTDDRLDGNYMILRYAGDSPLVTTLEDHYTKENLPIQFTPNPIQDRSTLYLSQGENGTLELFDSMGRLVLHREGVKSGDIIEKGTLSPGIYVYRFYGNQQTKTGKITIQ